MNCEHVSGIVDAGTYHMLPAAEREAARAHARSCEHCAPAWAAHERLATKRIPPMPAEFAARARTLAMVAASRRQPASRRWTVVGAVAALAAAAAMLAIYMMSQQASPPAPVAIIPPGGSEAAAPVMPPQVATPLAVRTEPHASRAAEPAPAQPDAALLLPPPDESARDRIIDQALQKVAEVHPELVQGPEMQGSFLVGALINRDGLLLESIVREVPPQSSTTPEGRSASQAIMREIDERITQQARASIQYVPRARKFLLPNKEALRAETAINLGVASSTFKPARSPAGIVAAIRSKHPDLSGMLAPASGGEITTLTVLVADDGSIEREVLTRNPRPSLPASPMSEEEVKRLIAERGGSTAGDASKLMAERISQALSVGVEEIGEIGMSSIREGDRYLVTDGTGDMRSVDNSGTLAITYAWRRRPGETGPYMAGAASAMRALAGMDEPNILAPTIDKTVAALVLKREIPDAFTSDYRQAGTPALVLNRRGEVIRAGRVRAPNGGQPDYGVLIRQLAPGIRIGQGMYGATIRDADGKSTEAAFAWEAAPDSN